MKLSVLKTSGIEKLAGHKNVILPQLAAAGIEATYIQKKTGWRAIWGPVYARDIPAFIENNFQKKSAMRAVRFSLVQRMEMAVMWAFPFSIITSPIVSCFWPEMLLPLNGVIWGLPFLLFLSFPLYFKRLDPKKKRVRFSKYTVIFDFGRIPLLLWGLFVFCLIGFSMMTNSFTWAFIVRWGCISFIVILIISIDLIGSTPLYKSGLHEERFFTIVLDGRKCKGAGFCEQVCPKNCYEVDTSRHVATMPGAEKCVQCGACIVQCPFDALCFMNPKGAIVSPSTVRRFKLTLIGERLKETEDNTGLSG